MNIGPVWLLAILVLGYGIGRWHGGSQHISPVWLANNMAAQAVFIQALCEVTPDTYIRQAMRRTDELMEDEYDLPSHTFNTDNGDR